MEGPDNNTPAVDASARPDSVSSPSAAAESAQQVQRVTMICAVLVATVAVAFGLYWLRPVLIPVVLAVLLMYALAPFVDWIMIQGRVGKGAALVVALALSVLGLLAVSELVQSSVQALAENKGMYAERAQALADKAGTQLQGWGLGADAMSSKLKALPVGDWAKGLADGLLGFLSNGFLVLIFLIYLLLGRNPAAGSRGIKGEIERRIKRYIVVKVALSAATGAAVWLILLALGVDLAVVFGLMAFFLNFIPSVGSIVATLLPLPVVLFDPAAGTATIVLAVALPAIVQLIIGNVLEPKILGQSLELHPITILVALVFWGMLWGVVGMILATPLTAVLKILCENSRLTRPVAQLMAGHLSEEAPAS